MSLVRRRLATALFAVTLATGAAVGCGASDTILAITFNPDANVKGSVLKKIQFSLYRGSDSSPDKKETLDVTAPKDETTAPAGFYKRYVLNGWDGKVKITADGLDENESTIEQGEANAQVMAGEVVAAAVNLKAPAAGGASGTGGAAGCNCPCATGGAENTGGSSDGAGGEAGSNANAAGSNTGGEAAGNTGGEAGNSGSVAGAAGQNQ